MGCSCSSGLSKEEQDAANAEAKKNKAIEAQIQIAQVEDRQINKLLLLGAGESGKSTIFKQMISLYGEGFTEDVRQSYTQLIHNNILDSIRTLVTYSDKLGESQCVVKEENEAAKAKIADLKGYMVIDSDIARCVKQLWEDEGVQNTYALRARFQLVDSAKYFFEKMDEVASAGYIPSESDVLRCRVRTTGIVENEFEVDGNLFKIFDVGGQRNERRKWIHCFENVTAVLFVVGASEYDQVLFEDETTNRMHEALNLFEQICNSPWFRDTSMILFLNKRDLFEDKISKVPLTVCFPQYSGEQLYDPAIQYVRFQFESRNMNPAKSVYTHITCATDSNNVDAVFKAVKDIIIRKNLKEAGLMAF